MVLFAFIFHLLFTSPCLSCLRFPALLSALAFCSFLSSNTVSSLALLGESSCNPAINVLLSPSFDATSGLALVGVWRGTVERYERNVWMGVVGIGVVERGSGV